MADKGPVDDSAFEEQELSEKELERKQRQEARREEKRRKQELARIRKEMRGPTPRWVFAALATLVLLLLVLAFGGYRFWCSYTVNLQRKCFMDDYNVADLPQIRRFAPAQLQRVEELKEAAAARSGALSFKEVAAKYREASEALAQAGGTARTNADAYDAALVRFRVLRDEAVRNKLSAYAPLLWKQIEEAEREATQDTARDFSVSLAIEKLNQGIRTLERASKSYIKLKDFDAAFAQFQAARSPLREEEWARNASGELAAVQSLVKRAEGAAEAMNWDESAEAYRSAAAAIPEAAAAVAALRSEAQEAVAMLKQAVKSAEAGGMQRLNPAEWNRIQTDLRAVEEYLLQYDYRLATRRARELTGQLGEAGEAVQKAREQLVGTLGEVKRLYDQAAAEEPYFRQYAREEWGAIQQQYQRIPELAREGKTMELVELAGALRQRLQGLIGTRNTLLTDLKAAQAKLEELQKAPLYQHLEKNYPEQATQLADTRQQAERRRERNDLPTARNLLVEASTGTDTLLRQLAETRTDVLTRRASLRERRTRYREGILRFLSKERTVLEQNSIRLDRLVDAHLYREALDVARGMETVVPRETYLLREPGLVLDFANGLMWVADGATPEGGNSGRPLDWYEALKWAASLRVDGHDDWRLPTEGELRVLSGLPASERNRFFPNTAPGVHWTRIPSNDVNSALAVDLATGSVTREEKRKAFAVRAVRQPPSP
ncbi:MAG: DUF1566 domain-containing protein [Lentisphaeria bacterium]|nr:DUF1566 domain-containing protein [Lentisphaeria bacterium]